MLNDQRQLFSFGKKGRTGHNDITPRVIASGIDEISFGQSHGFALNTREGILYSWGFNLYGQANPSI